MASIQSMTHAHRAGAAWHQRQPFCQHSMRPSPLLRRQLSALRVASKEVYQGRFGPWSVEEADVTEVTLYRVGISVATAAVVVASVPALLPGGAGEAAQHVIAPLLNPIVLTGSLGLGASLVLIHIYVDPLKKFLQALWLTGTLGSVWLMATQDTPAALYVVENPWAVWLVGPMFAALTGVAFKEGLCYGKAEAAALFFTVPLLLLGHLSQLVPLEGEKGLLAAMVVILSVFAARKYTQPIKDDIGDKSVFMFLGSTPEQQQQMMAASQAQQQVEEEED